MSLVLILSSSVAYGHVGLSAGMPVLQRLGHAVTALPTVTLSNHPGWTHVAGAATEPKQLRGMIDALDANGWLAAHSALLVGYMPSVEHVAVAEELIPRMRSASRDLRVTVDPILGDTPQGLYVPQHVAEAVRDRLLPLADTVTPNLFELEWLSGRTCPDVTTAAHAAQSLGPERVIVTSPPLPQDTGVLSVSPSASDLYQTPRYADMPHGVGDVFAALVAAGLPVGQALGHLEALARLSQGGDHLDITGGASIWTAAPPIAAQRI
ncbi:Pyridoxal kinase [Candidatus Rhodobacter oscarellae]|uniref:pyridoxal kinase n=1 Tax=Candidatus Rhodobacter oscarellae TaxID=1675527 RepID=A0A0J9EC98_9RHOB|nr:pyridoxal kinase [Candidatus Rhodobacter lobularis]KMW60397.1 Pyridoxal kinase [Candidatus Rhodobacter lobularis]